MIAQARSAWPLPPPRLARYVTWRPLSVMTGRIDMKALMMSFAPPSNCSRPDWMTFFALNTIWVLSSTE